MFPWPSAPTLTPSNGHHDGPLPLRSPRRGPRKDPERLRRETGRLYAEENASPYGGCASLLVQAPVIGLLYAVFVHPSIAGHANALLAANLSGVPLGVSPVGALTSGTLSLPACALFGGIVVSIVLVAEATRRLSPGADAVSSALTGPLRLIDLLPFSTAVVATMVPLAAAIYLVVTVTWTLAQRVVLRRLYPPGTARG